MILGFSYWWILPMLVISLVVARIKYKKIIKMPDISSGLALFIATLRFLVLFILFVLLLGPTLSWTRIVKEKPILIIAQDNSSSLLNTKDSSYYRKEYPEFLKNKFTPLEDKYTLEWLTFGKKVEKNGTVDFSENYTDISGLFDYVDKNYNYRRPGAIILLSDGIYNTGVNPRYRVSSSPIYTVNLGDTTEFPDVYIKEVSYDKFNFIRTIFPIKADIAALKQNGKEIKCILKEGGNVIAEETIDINADNFLKEITFQVEAKRTGVVRYTLELKTGFEERSVENNQAVLYIDIIDNSGEIDIFYSAPHPDIAALSEAISVSGIYNCHRHNLSKALPEIKSDMIILHNPVPENQNYQKIKELAAEKGIALWYILTDKKHISDFARYGKEYTVSFNTDMVEYATISYNRDFPYFEFSEREITAFTAYPPVLEPFGEIKTLSGKSLFTQKIKNTTTTNGLLTFYDGESKTAYFWGEGLWRWRLYSFREEGNHELFNTLINKIVGYLSMKRGNERFIHDIRPLYDETEEAIINVELYNDSYELVNSPDVKLQLKYEGKDFNYLLNRNGDKYRINLGNLSAGEYAYNLSVDFKGEHFEKKGTFYVRTQNPERNDMIANKQLLRELAVNSNGLAIEKSDIDHLMQVLEHDSDEKPVYKSETKYINMGELWLPGILLLLLLCIEWFLLKYYVD